MKKILISAIVLMALSSSVLAEEPKGMSITLSPEILEVITKAHPELSEKLINSGTINSIKDFEKLSKPHNVQRMDYRDLEKLSESTGGQVK